MLAASVWKPLAMGWPGFSVRVPEARDPGAQRGGHMAMQPGPQLQPPGACMVPAGLRGETDRALPGGAVVDPCRCSQDIPGMLCACSHVLLTQ